jgi:hypothetical protein
MAEVETRASRRRSPRSVRDEVVVEELITDERRGDRRGAGREASPPRPLCSFAFCPICMALTAIGEAKPDLVDHLLTASREMLLAVRALIDARLEGTATGPPPTKLERLTIE